MLLNITSISLSLLCEVTCVSLAGILNTVIHFLTVKKEGEDEEGEGKKTPERSIIINA